MVDCIRGVVLFVLHLDLMSSDVSSATIRSKSHFRTSVTHIPQGDICDTDDDNVQQWITQTDIELVFEQATGNSESITLEKFLSIMLDDDLYVHSNVEPQSFSRKPTMHEHGHKNRGELGNYKAVNDTKRLSQMISRRTSLPVGGHKNTRSLTEDLSMAEISIDAPRSVA